MASTAELIQSLTDAVSSATAAFPQDENSVLPPVDGISLLDIKNELLLSYLQNLAFLLLLRLKQMQNVTSSDGIVGIHEGVTKKLVELRVFLERGVRPLESKLQYQIDKVLRAAEDAERQGSRQKTRPKSKIKSNGATGSDSSDAESEAGDDSDVNSDDEAQELMYRPNAAALVQQARQEQEKASRSRTSATGAYKPPHITPTVMPGSRQTRDRDADMPARRRKSNLVDEYIDEEMSSAPRAQPSIGSNSTILDRGRGGLSARDREKERERNEYEESHFVRLPAESKAERRKAKARGERDRRDMFGGEDWTGLGGLGDRINRTVAGKGGSSVLERREKRKRDTEDRPRGDGLGIGDAFDRKKRVLEGRADKKRRRKG